jgi:hypothetical protein
MRRAVVQKDARVQSLCLGSASSFVLVVVVEQVRVREARVLEGSEAVGRLTIGLGVGMPAVRAL